MTTASDYLDKLENLTRYVRLLIMLNRIDEQRVLTAMDAVEQSLWTVVDIIEDSDSQEIVA